MDSNYYRIYFEFDNNHWWFKARMELIANYIQKYIYCGQPLKILNVGAASGTTSIMLRKFGVVESIEYNLDCIEYAKKKLDISIKYGDINALDFPESQFDLVCAFDVIEHVEEHETAIKELTRVCKHEGVVLTTVPALMQLWSEHDVVNHHFRRYHLKEFRQLLDGHLNVRYISYFNFYLFLPIYVFRKISTIFKPVFPKRKAKSDFEKIKFGVFSNLLYRLFRSEFFFLGRQIKLPIGVSILAHAKKNKAAP